MLVLVLDLLHFHFSSNKEKVFFYRSYLNSRIQIKLSSIFIEGWWFIIKSHRTPPQGPVIGPWGGIE